MKLFNLYTLPIALAAATALSFSGCGQQANQDNATPDAAASHDDHDHEGDGHASHDHEGEPTHGGWWCYEHAVPEEQCAMCDAKLAAELREKGDWCEEHSRPDSLCFKCHPENAEKFVALYEAKYGKKPPEPTE